MTVWTAVAPHRRAVIRWQHEDGSMKPADLPRPVTPEQIQQFRDDGVVILRGILSIDWLDSLAEPIERVITGGGVVDLGSMVDGPASAPAFQAGVDHWRTDAAFAAFALLSPLPAIVAQLLGSSHVALWEDSVLVKEPGSPHPTRFHTDASYFNCVGDQICTVWVPFDATDSRNGALQWVRASHKTAEEYRPNLFVTDAPIDGTRGAVVPDVANDPELAARVITWELEPGDITVHHARTLHGAPANRSHQRRRAVSVRYCGDDATFTTKPGIPRKAEMAEAPDGARVGPPWCPTAWPRPVSS
jgi:hypothetical protein